MKIIEKYNTLPEWLRWILFLPALILISLIGIFLTGIAAHSLSGDTFFSSIVSMSLQHLLYIYASYTLIPRWKNGLLILGIIFDLLIFLGLVPVFAIIQLYLLVSGRAIVPMDMEYISGAVVSIFNLMVIIAFYEHSNPDSKLIKKIKKLKDNNLTQRLGALLGIPILFAFIILVNLEFFQGVFKIVTKWFSK